MGSLVLYLYLAFVYHFDILFWKVFIPHFVTLFQTAFLLTSLLIEKICSAIISCDNEYVIVFACSLSAVYAANLCETTVQLWGQLRLQGVRIGSRSLAVRQILNKN